jgi:Domain of unknown function (DUF397)
MGTLTTRWRKSSYSGGNGGACIEIATRRHDGHILVRDSKDSTGGTLRFSPDAWRRFAAQLKRRPLAPDPNPRTDPAP